MKKLYILWLFLFVLLSCNTDKNASQEADVTDYHRKMKQELQRLVDDGNPQNYYHWNLKRALSIVPTIPNIAGVENSQKRLIYGIEVLNAGRTQDAIINLEALANDYRISMETVDIKTKAILDCLALAYLRLGEQENCINRPSSGSCTLPISSTNVYSLKAGPEKAISILLPLLDKFPEDINNRWLLNLAYMTLGQYPQKVPAKWLIPIGDKGSSQMFVEKAAEKSIDFVGLSGGVIAEDFNNDGWIDIFCTSYGMQDSPKLYLNDQNGGFSDVSDKAGLEGLFGGLNCMQTDYNNDGWMDIFILRGGWLHASGKHPNSLLENQGDGTFKDITFKVGLEEASPTQTAVWLDFDRDGWLDVFIGNESDNGAFPSKLFRNNEGKFFDDVTKKSGINVNVYAKGVNAGDIDLDGFPELYISNLKGRNILLKNEKGHFREITDDALVAGPSASFPCWFWDVDQDGHQDVFVSSYETKQLNQISSLYASELLGETIDTEFPKLYMNAKDGTFIESSSSSDLDKVSFAMGSNYGDVNNDGYPDILLGNGSPNLNSIIPNRFFMNINGERFVEKTYESGLAHIQKGHGITMADFDRDGDLDIYMVVGGAYEGDVFANAYYENYIENLGSYISIKLTDKSGKRATIGTRVIVNVESPKGPKSYYGTVGSGSSFGANPMELFVGLADASSIKSIEVVWAGTDKKQVYTENIKINNLLSFQQS